MVHKGILLTTTNKHQTLLSSQINYLSMLNLLDEVFQFSHLQYLRNLPDEVCQFSHLQYLGNWAEWGRDSLIG